MKMKLFKYGYLVRIGFEHGRFIPFLAKQKFIAKFIAGASAQIVEIPNTLTLGISEMLFKTNHALTNIFSSNSYLLILKLSGSIFESQARLSAF